VVNISMKLVNNVSYKPLVGISSNLYFVAVGRKDELIRLRGQRSRSQRDHTHGQISTLGEMH